MKFKLLISLLAATALSQPAHADTEESNSNSPAEMMTWAEFAGPIFADAPDGAALNARCDADIAEIERRFAALETQQGPANIGTTLRAYDDLTALMDATAAEFYSFGQSMDSADKREAGFDCYTRIEEIATRLGLSRAVYDRLTAIDASGANRQTIYYLEETLAAFERSGVALEGEDRERFQQLQLDLSELGSRYNQNYANARAVIKVLPRELAGMPQDWIDAHPVGIDGLIEVSTDGTDWMPVMQYAEDDDLREKLTRVYYSRAFPENSAILAEIFTKRDELARLLGRPDYATLNFESRMLKTPEAVEAHIAELAAAAEPAEQFELELLQAVLDEQAEGQQLDMFNSTWTEQQVLKQRYNLDPQEVRQYFTYNNTRDGIFELTQDLFNIEIRPWDTTVWHPDVEAYEIYDNNGLLGAFYLDSHPRPGKYQHANHIGLRSGVTGISIPVSVLTMNLPKGGYDTGLMEHRDVETFLHEFGHLIHHILGGNQEWFALSGITTEHDFVEAPSQMLEEWVYDYDTLQRFARNEAGEVIPRDLVGRMNAARRFGQGITEKGQLGYTNASLRFHQGAPADPSPEAISSAYRAYHAEYSPFPRPEGTHQEATFSHLEGYSAGYYTYGWSRVIAADLFSRFKAEGLRNPQVAADYRNLVLGRGGSRPAAELIEDFLGRPVNADAFKESLLIDDESQ
jgi:thimet oligopeptidase